MFEIPQCEITYETPMGFLFKRYEPFPLFSRSNRDDWGRVRLCSHFSVAPEIIAEVQKFLFLTTVVLQL